MTWLPHLLKVMEAHPMWKSSDAEKAAGTEVDGEVDMEEDELQL